ncbi:MAG: HEAT repeat domain-containing protein, partial [Planctomycetaceae bacterium]
MRTGHRLLSLSPLLWLAVSLLMAQLAVAAIEPDFLMDSDPEIPVPQPVRNFNPLMAELWVAALERPETDMQRMAAETISRAHQLGMPDLRKAVPRLEEIVQSASSHPAARFAAARALIMLESRSSSEKLFDASQAFGSDLRQLIEPALADWNFGPAKTMWIDRLGASETRPRDLVLAVRGLGQVRESSALPRLLSIAGDMSREPEIRLEAATAAGRIADTSLEGDADRLARNTRTPLFVNQMCAIRLLARQNGDAARQLLVDLAGHAEPVVAAAALVRLNEIDSALAAPLALSAMISPDQHVRRQGALCYLRLPTDDRIGPLSQLLADADPGIRREVCEGLFRLGTKPEWSAPIRDA